MSFAMHPRLEADTLQVVDLALCRVRLMNDSRFPWLVLMPRRPDLRELFDLTAPERTTLIEEVATMAQTLQDITGAAKMNIGAIGNVVPQLHVHAVARFETDAAWPAPVWGFGTSTPYGEGAAEALIATLRTALTRPATPNPDP